MRHPILFTSLLAVACQGEAAMDASPAGSGVEALRPSIEAIDPPAAASTGGDSLVVHGAGFRPGLNVRIAGAPAERVRWLSERQVQVQAPARLGVYGRVPVEVVNPDGAHTLRDDVLSYFAGIVQFRAHVDYPFGVSPIGMQLLDLDGDSRLDLVTAFEARGIKTPQSTVSVMLGRSDGTFSFSADYPSGNDLYGLAVGDVSGDGVADIAMINSRQSTLSLYLGQGDGTFGARRDLPTGAYPVTMVLADLDRDGRQDLVTANAEGASLSLLLSQGGGNFTTHTVRLQAAPWAIAAGDVNGDGSIDLAVTAFRHKEVNILLGRGDGTFLDTRSEYATGASPYALALGDLDNDRKLDLVVANRSSNTVTVMLGKGDGTFAHRGSPYVGNAPIGVILGDVNGDRRLDVLVPCNDLKAVSVLVGQGDGRFRPVSFYPSSSYIAALALGDINGDGLPDLVVGNSNATYSVLLNASL